MPSCRWTEEDLNFLHQGIDPQPPSGTVPDDLDLLFRRSTAKHTVASGLWHMFGEKTHFVKSLNPEQKAAVINARLRGWVHTITDNPEVPRANVTWNGAEDESLVRRAKTLGGRADGLTVLALVHGRTETAIVCRLEYLGFDRGFTAAMDFSAVETHVVDRAAITNPPKKASPMKMTPARLSLLTMAYLDWPGGFYMIEKWAVGGASGAAKDLNLLKMEGLMDHPIGSWAITDKGRALIEALTDSASTVKASKNPKASKVWDSARETSVLSPDTFYLVASGDVTGASSGRVYLKKPPKSVHGVLQSAQDESLRLAEGAPGETFFVLQAVASNTVEKVVAPVYKNQHRRFK